MVFLRSQRWGTPRNSSIPLLFLNVESFTFRITRLGPYPAFSNEVFSRILVVEYPLLPWRIFGDNGYEFNFGKVFLINLSPRKILECKFSLTRTLCHNRLVSLQNCTFANVIGTDQNNNFCKVDFDRLFPYTLKFLTISFRTRGCDPRGLPWLAATASVGGLTFFGGISSLLDVVCGRATLGTALGKRPLTI